MASNLGWGIFPCHAGKGLRLTISHGDGDWQEVVSLNEAQKIERELAAMKQEKHLSEQSASYNIDWFDCLVSDLAKILGCESKASAVIEAARVAAQRKG